MHKHQELGLSFAEFGALLGTRALIIGGYLKHTVEGDLVPGEHIINMNTTCKANECGSVHCIGGTMALLMRMTAQEANRYVRSQVMRPALHELFYPEGYDFDAITPEQMVQAIDNLINTGKPQWNLIIPKG